MRIAAVVVTYNRCALLEECVEALLRSTVHADILVIDNASTDGTREVVQRYLEKGAVQYYNTGANIGGAGGFNYGIRKACEAGYDSVWVMDDDTMVQPDTLQMLVDAAEDLRSHWGWLSSLALWTDGSECKMNYHDPADDFNSDKKGICKSRVKCKWASFVSMLINCEAVRTVGLPIKEYFIWGDDLEFSQRVSRQYPCYLVANSQVIHKMQTNTGVTFEEETDPARIDRGFYSIRNDLCTNRRRGAARLLRYLIRWAQRFVRILCGNQPYKARKLAVLLRGLWAGLLFHPPIEYL